MMGGSVDDFDLCLVDCWSTNLTDEWSTDFDLLYEFMSRFLGDDWDWSELRIASLSGDVFFSPFDDREELIEIFADGGDESNNEKRRNILFSLSHTLFMY